jgi:hypothetical protein
MAKKNLHSPSLLSTLNLHTPSHPNHSQTIKKILTPIKKGFKTLLYSIILYIFTIRYVDILQATLTNVSPHNNIKSK